MTFYYWITSYIVVGFLFTIFVDWANDFAIKYGYTEDTSPIENGDRWILSLLWPLGIVVMIKSLIDYFVNRE